MMGRADAPKFFVGLVQGVSVFNDMFGIHTFPHKKSPLSRKRKGLSG